MLSTHTHTRIHTAAPSFMQNKCWGPRYVWGETFSQTCKGCISLCDAHVRCRVQCFSARGRKRKRDQWSYNAAVVEMIDTNHQNQAGKNRLGTHGSQGVTKTTVWDFHPWSRSEKTRESLNTFWIGHFVSVSRGLGHKTPHNPRSGRPKKSRNI